MAGRIEVYGFGKSGVVIDLSPLDAGVPDDSLRLAQNATFNPTAEEGGALVKRKGLKQFNLVNAGGAILGGIPMPVAGTGGAPAAGGGGSTGSSTGTGDGTGAPGGTTDGSDPAYPAPGAALFNSGSPVFSGARLLLIGRSSTADAANTTGLGWFVSSKGLADAATAATTPGAPGASYSYPFTTLYPTACGHPMAYHPPSGYLYYMKTHEQATGAVQSVLRKTNGAIDVALLSIPWNTVMDTTTQRQAILGLQFGPFNLLYIVVKDQAKGQATAGNYTGNIGRLLQYDTVLGTLNELTVSFAEVLYQHMPYCVAYFNAGSQAGNGVYVGNFDLDASELQKDTNGTIYACNGGAFAAEFTTTNGEGTTCLLAFPGGASPDQCLFAGTATNKTSAAFAPLYARTREAFGTASAWAAQTTGLGSGGVGGTVANANHWSALAEFRGNLYAVHHNPGTQTNIFQLVPDYTSVASDGHWDGSGTWTVVKTLSSTIGALNLFVDDGVLYAIGSVSGVSSSSIAWTTTDGTTWVDKHTSLPVFATGSVPLNIAFGVDQ